MDSQRLVDARNALGWSQQKLAEEMHTSQQTISRYESGARDPQADRIKQMADVLGVTVSYLLGISDDPHEEGVASWETVSSIEERELLRCFRLCTPEWKQNILMSAQAAAGESLKKSEGTASGSEIAV